MIRVGSVGDGYRSSSVDAPLNFWFTGAVRFRRDSVKRIGERPQLVSRPTKRSIKVVT